MNTKNALYYEEERIQCDVENTLWNMSVVGNVVMKCRREILEKSATEVIKNTDSSDHCEEYMQHKYGENGI